MEGERRRKLPAYHHGTTASQWSFSTTIRSYRENARESLSDATIILSTFFPGLLCCSAPCFSAQAQRSRPASAFRVWKNTRAASCPCARQCLAGGPWPRPARKLVGRHSARRSQTAKGTKYTPPPACPRTWQWGCGLEQPMAWPLFSKICTHLYLGPSSVIWSAQVSRTLRMSYVVKERSIEMISLSSLDSFSPHWQKRTGTVMRGSVMSLHG